MRFAIAFSLLVALAAPALAQQQRPVIRRLGANRAVGFDKDKGSGGGDKGSGGGGDKTPPDDSEERDYIITFKHSDESAQSKCGRIGARGHATKNQGFSKLDMCSLKGMTRGNAKLLKGDPDVEHVEEDLTVHALQTPIPSGGWGLDRVDQCASGLDGKETKQEATGVKVFIIDTGIQADHPDFGGPGGLVSTTLGFSSIENEPEPRVDGNGHGTHVASTACGVQYGVAEECDLIAIKVLSSGGSGSTSGVIAGVDYVAANCGPQDRCVANMSLGGGFSQASNDAVQRAVDAGITVVVAAGNSNNNACGSSPASATAAITVGSTTNTDARSSFSSFGPCLDIWAPGSGIQAAYPPATYASLSGTSMASPHVAGLAAGVAYRNTPDTTPEAILAGILSTSSPLATDIGFGTTTDMIASSGGPCPTPAPTTPPPTVPCTGDIKVELTTDNFGSETSWDIKDVCANGAEVMSSPGSGYSSNTAYTEEKCVPDHRFTFTIKDTFGDGICCGYGTGSYSVLHKGVVQTSGGSFGSQTTFSWGTCDATPPTTPPPQTPPPTAAPTNAPTSAPTSAPTGAPTNKPTTMCKVLEVEIETNFVPIAINIPVGDADVGVESVTFSESESACAAGSSAYADTA